MLGRRNSFPRVKLTFATLKGRSWKEEIPSPGGNSHVQPKRVEVGKKKFLPLGGS
jgi:hypothetical protein